MKKIIVGLLMVLSVVGCQPAPKEDTVNKDRREAAQKLFAQSLIMLQQKDLKGAVGSLQAAIQADPSDPNPYLLLGQILIKAEQYDQAASFLEQTAKRFKDNGTAFYLLSIASKMDNKVLPAVLSARRSYEIFSANGDADNAKASAILLEELVQAAQQQENNSVDPKDQLKKEQTIVKK